MMKFPEVTAFLLLAYFSLYILQARAALGVSGQVTAAPLSISARLLAVSPCTEAEGLILRFGPRFTKISPATAEYGAGGC